MVVVKSKKILVLIIIALIVILFANIMIIKSKKFSKIEKEKEIVTEINNTDNEEIENTTNLKVGPKLYNVLDKEKYNPEPSEYNNFQLLDNYAYILEDNMNILLFLDYDF